MKYRLANGYKLRQVRGRLSSIPPVKPAGVALGICRIPRTGILVTGAAKVLHDDAERGFEAEDVSLRKAIRIAGGSFENGGRAFYTVDPERDYTDGSEKYYGIHPPHSVTQASYNRIARLLGCSTRT